MKIKKKKSTEKQIFLPTLAFLLVMPMMVVVVVAVAMVVVLVVPMTLTSFFCKEPGGVNVGDHTDDDAGGDRTVDDDDNGAKWAAGGVEDAVGIEAEG